MEKKDCPRLSGGTFFRLVLEARKQHSGARKNLMGIRDGLSDPEVLTGLIKVINPDYSEPREEKLKRITNDFKSCRISQGAYLPFGNTQEIMVFDYCVRNDYRSALSAMNSFVLRFLETCTQVGKDKNLVKALIDLVKRDESILPDEEFYIEESGGKIKKAAFGGLERVCLPAFLLGIWHYAVVYRKDNTVGRETYVNWCPANDGAHREYTGDMGRNIKDVDLYMPDLSEDAEVCDPAGGDESQFDEGGEFHDEKETPPPPAQQIMNNPLFISQTGGGSTVIPNYGTINLRLGGKGGETDER